ncbi:glycosyltransferase family 2 protein [Vibrio breoganii]
MISFVMLCYNRSDIINESISTILNLSSDILNDSIELIVVDNNSTDNSKEIYEKFRHRSNVKIILNGENLGVAKGRNIGIKNCVGEWIYVLDDDSVIDPSAITEFLKYKNSDVGIFALNVKNMGNGNYFKDDLIDVEFLSNFYGAAHIINRKLVDKIGMLDEDCSFGGEELDYTIRSRKAGMKVKLLEEGVVYHYCLVRSGSTNWERRTKWLYNYTRVINKHFSFKLRIIFSTRYMLNYLVGSLSSKSPTLIFILFKSYIRGIIDGGRINHPMSGDLELKYRSKKMRPQYGNVSLLEKIKSML